MNEIRRGKFIFLVPAMEYFYVCYCISISWAFQVTQVVNPLANPGGTRDASLSQEDSLE